MSLIIGINGFGRIGKCCFLQLIDDTSVQVTCINATSLSVKDVEDYLRYDSTHRNYNRNFDFKILDENTFQINHHIVKLVSDRNPANIQWRKYGCKMVIEATGAFLTTEKCSLHDVDNVIITSPAKDNTPTYIYGVNHEKFCGEKIISASSCTTNSLAPILNILDLNFGIKNAIFTTIHASTASQNTVDIVDQKARTSRSIFNNIIPHTTGASSSLSFVLPNLTGKVFGTSVRVPVVNCSLLDLNVELAQQPTLDQIYNVIKSNKYYGSVYDISNKKLVSSDFSTTTIPCILDAKSSICAGNGKFKFMTWYDNEWSYSTQIIRTVKYMSNYNEFISGTYIRKKHFIENIDFSGKRVVCRFDYNVPVSNGCIKDEFRITSTIPTIQYILSKNPKQIILVSHYGRPDGYDKTKSLNFIVPVLNRKLNANVIFLDKGVSSETLELLDNNKEVGNIYLLENIRFHKEETEYENMSIKDIDENLLIQNYSKLGDVFISDAFGCMHRKHMSIHLFSQIKGVNFGYGYLVKREIENISSILNNDKKKLGIIGGNKISDKMPLIDLMKSMNNTFIFIGGKIALSYVLNKNDNNVFKMTDGFGALNLEDDKIYIPDINNTTLNVYDIGTSSYVTLYNLIQKCDVIFWNGSLGVIENDKYSVGSRSLIDLLLQQKNKTIIIGGGDTSSITPKDSNIYVSTGGGALLELLENISKKNGYLVGLDIFSG